MDFDATGFGTLPVPSVWQMHGFDNHQYSNIRYPFPFDPPCVPQRNPCGAYIHIPMRLPHDESACYRSGNSISEFLSHGMNHCICTRTTD